MNLEQAFEQILDAVHLTLNEVEFAPHAETQLESLVRYAAEDTVGGRGGHWSAMSVYEDEGRLLYALVRLLRPEVVVEVGVHEGGTSTHILTAMDRNQRGVLYSYDIDTGVGSKVPEHLRYRWRLTEGQDALTADLPERADLCFEDGPHSYEWTRDMLLRLKGLQPRLILTHDLYMHRTYPEGFEVERAFWEVFPESGGIQLDGTITGMGYVWLK